MKIKFLRAALIASACGLLAGCTTDGEGVSLLATAPKVSNITTIGLKLRDLPPPEQPVDVAIYAFPDLTGQYKESDTTTEYSRAVTQGASAFLSDALQQAGNGRWFTVVERGGLQNLLQERQIIATTRQQYDPKAPGLPPLRFAGLIIEGGIVGYDTNTTTGGAGAKYLGIGGDAKYRKDVITVSLRVVSVQSGVVLDSITTTKTLYSVAINGGAFRYVALNELLEIEAGLTRNEPATMGVREAVEVAVMALVVDGARKNIWSFADPAAGKAVIEAFLRKEGKGSRLDDAKAAPGSTEVAQLPPTRPSTARQAAADRALSASDGRAAEAAADKRVANTVAPATVTPPPAGRPALVDGMQTNAITPVAPLSALPINSATAKMTP